jgi:hypothetical protein
VVISAPGDVPRLEVLPEDVDRERHQIRHLAVLGGGGILLHPFAARGVESGQ